MKQHLTEKQRQELDKRVAETEKRTGAQIVLSVISRSDIYAELPWKAFALGASIAGFAVVMLDILRPEWITATAVLLAVIVTLAAGACFALAAVNVPAFARIFLDAHRAEVEVRQYAESLFLSRELFATRGRTGILLLVSFFERQVVLLPDTGVAKRLSRETQKSIIKRMAAPLSAGQASAALELGLSGLEEALSGTAPKTPYTDELPNGVVEEKGI